MARQSKLTPEQWAVAKVRWEGDPRHGFAWLGHEIEAAWGVRVHRQALDQMSKAQGWEKRDGGEPSKPLEAVDKIAGPKSNAKSKIAPRHKPPPASNVVALPGAKPPPKPPPAKREVADEVTDDRPLPAMRMPAARLNDYGLNPAEERFATLVAKGLSQTDAFLDAFPASAEWKRESVHEKASALAGTIKVGARITDLVQAAARANEVDVARVMREHLLRLNADPRELAEVRVSCCRHCWGKAHRRQFTDGELADARLDHEAKRELAIESGRPDPGEFDERGGGGYSAQNMPNPDCPSCGGVGVARAALKDSRTYGPAALALFGGVKESDKGIEIKIADRESVLSAMARHVGFFEADNQREVHHTVDVSELDAIYERAMAKSRLDAERARGRMARLANPEPEPLDEAGALPMVEEVEEAARDAEPGSE